ncbi:MAG: YhdP family protein, partial [Burkholderiales bacterium]
AWHARQLVLVDGRGERWPGSELKFSQQYSQPTKVDAGTFSADRIDLTQLAGFARSLPLTADARATLTQLAPKGVIDGLDIGWNGPPQVFPPLRFQASGHARGIEFAAQPAAARAGVRSNPGVPGLRGADIAFDLNQDGGQATLRMTAGTATFPGIFEEPTVPFAQLSTAVTWQRRDGQWEVTAPDLKFANADTAGSARVRWRSDTPTPTSTPTAPPKKASPAAAATGSPGSIELDGNLERGNVARLHRYLPLELPGPVRRYLRDALSAGSTSAVRFQVKGALRDFPYVDAKRGQFRLVAQLRDTTFVYAPPSSQPAGEVPWPPLTQLNGELVVERTSLQVNRARGRLGSGASGLPIGAASASIADFDQPRVRVDASTQAPLSDLLSGMRNSPLDAMLDQALRTASGSGNAQLKVQLNLPIEQIERATVQGSLTLAGNDLRMDADGLELKRVHGDIAFTERGFQLNGLDAQLFGGPVHIEGGSTTAPRSDSGPATALVEVRARGTANAQGLRAAPNAGPLAQIAQALNGAADYDAQLRVLRGGTELTVTSDLRGLAIELPAPLGKSAETALALRYENTPVFTERAGAVAQDRLALRLGDVASLDYRRALHTDGARVLRGSVALGPPAAAAHALPASGVAAHVELARFEPGRWNDALAALQHAPEPAAGRKSGQPSVTTSPAASSTANMRSYWPSQWQARVGTFASENVALHRLSLDGTREGTVWRSTAQADELAGRLEFRESADGGPGRLLARLSRLRLANPDVALASSAVSPRAGAVTAATEALPALDVVVDRFELQGRDLGRLEIDAVNQPAESGAAREWSLKKLVLTVPEATFTAQGKWTQPPTAGVGSAARGEKPRTALDFKLDLNDSGRLLERFGMKDVVRQGRGEMLGWLVWNGSPVAFDYPTLGGQFHLDVAAGQFLKVEPGFAKLLGVLSLQALPRRLSLDFRDLFSSGFAFDFVRGDVLVQRGVASSNNLQMKGASAAVLMEGLADIEAETQSLKVVVVPEIDAGTAALVATAINPALGLGTFLAQYFLRKPLSRAATRVFQIDGTWSDPRITKVTGRSNPDEVQAGPPMAADSGH